MRCLPALHLSPHLRTTSSQPVHAAPLPDLGVHNRQVVPALLCQSEMREFIGSVCARCHSRPGAWDSSLSPAAAQGCANHGGTRTEPEIPNLPKSHRAEVISAAALCIHSRGFTHGASCDVTALS